MKLVVSECKPNVYQEIRALEPIFVTSIRPHLYLHNTASGSVHVELQDTNGKTVASSNSIALNDPSLKTLAYAHKYYTFDIDCNLVQDSIYRIAVVCDSGYSFSESAYVGVCHDWDNTRVALGYEPIDDLNKPLDFEIWQRTIK